jgi:hypothetical protein
MDKPVICRVLCTFTRGSGGCNHATPHKRHEAGGSCHFCANAMDGLPPCVPATEVQIAAARLKGAKI